MAITENEALCRILTKKLGAPADKESSCLKIVEDFINHKKFDQTLDELTNLLGKSKEEITEVISTACIPCEFPEVIKT